MTSAKDYMNIAESLSQLSEESKVSPQPWVPCIDENSHFPGFSHMNFEK